MTGSIRWLVGVTVLAAIGVPALAAGEEPQPAGLRTNLRMFQDVYETGDVIRGELTVVNPGEKWVSIQDASDLAGSLVLIDGEGKRFEPRKAGRFGAAKTRSIGPGGFVGVTFDAGLLFPRLSQPGDYSLRVEREGLEPVEAALKMIPAFSASKSYLLKLETSAGELGILLDAAAAPVAVHNVVNLARTGFYDGALIPRVQKGVALKISAPVTQKHRILPQEKTAAPMLAGTVLVEPVQPGRRPFNLPNLIVLLGPQPEWEGTATAIGSVVSGTETLDKLAEVGSRAGATVSRAVIVEKKVAGGK